MAEKKISQIIKGGVMGEDSNNRQNSLPHFCKDIEMTTRVTRIEQQVHDLSSRLDRTEAHLDSEIKALRKALEMLKNQIEEVKKQISGLEVRLALIVGLSVGGVSVFEKIIPWLLGV